MKKEPEKLQMTKVELKEFEETLAKIKKHWTDDKFTEARKLTEQLIKNFPDIAEHLAELKQDDRSDAKTVAGTVKTVVSNKGNAGGMAKDILSDFSIIDKIRNFVKESAVDWGFNIDDQIDNIGDKINGGLEVLGTSIKNAGDLRQGLIDGYNNVTEDIPKYIETGEYQPRLAIEVENSWERGKNSYSRNHAKDNLLYLDNNVKNSIEVSPETLSEMIKSSIDQYKSEDSNWEFSDEAKKYYENYFQARITEAKDNAAELLKIQEEQDQHYKDSFEKTIKRKQEEEEFVNNYVERLAKITNDQFDEKQARITKEDLIAEHEAQLRNEKVKGLEAVEAVQIKSIDSQAVLAQNNEKINKQVADSEADSQKNRLDQWQEYAEKAAEISQKISEATGMVTSSLGGMFGQLGSYYADQVQAFADKIAVLDEEKEAALERVALSEEERQAKEEEIAMQKIELEYATSDEQRAKADERIATLQGELSAEDTISREFGDKKAELEKEKAKKEAEQKKAEKMEKRLQMSQAIVEAIGDVAAGAAKALKYGPILGPIMAAIVSAAGAVQVGIMSKQLTKMKDGGLLRGLSHARGGMPILGSNVEVEGGEYVVNKQSTSKNLGLLEYINGERRGLGYMDMNTYFGEQSVPPSFLSQMMNEPSVVPQLPMAESVDTNRILSAIDSINFQPRVSVTDINTVHDNMVKVDEWTGL